MSSQAPDKNTDVVTTIRLPRDHRDRLREKAEQEHRTLSGEIRRLVERYLDDDAQAA